MPLLQQSVVAYDETEAPQLRKALTLADAISDLPEVSDLYFTLSLPFLLRFCLNIIYRILFLFALYIIFYRLETNNPKM
jgi:hypothetical protein